MSSDLAEFLLARIAEDESEARDMAHDWPYDGGWSPKQATRVLAECEVKRRIVAEAEHAWTTAIDPSEPEGDEWRLGRRWGWQEVLRFLALPYADHPGYVEAWRP